MKNEWSWNAFLFILIEKIHETINFEQKKLIIPCWKTPYRIRAYEGEKKENRQDEYYCKRSVEIIIDILLHDRGESLWCIHRSTFVLSGQ